MGAPTNAGDFVGNECYITGWGRLFGNGPLPNILQEANVDIYSQTECRQSWGNRITNIHICLGDRATRQRGACNGDSGGPLSCKVGNDWQVAGVTPGEDLDAAPNLHPSTLVSLPSDPGSR